MARNPFVPLVLVTSILVAGCAGVARPGPTGAPALAGRWQGSIWETGAWLYQGSTSLDLTLDADGRWRGKVGSATAAGTARLTERGWLILEGTARGTDGREEPVYLGLTGDETRRWGATVGVFAGRGASASVSLQKVP